MTYILKHMLSSSIIFSYPIWIVIYCKWMDFGNMWLICECLQGKVGFCCVWVKHVAPNNLFIFPPAPPPHLISSNHTWTCFPSPSTTLLFSTSSLPKLSSSQNTSFPALLHSLLLISATPPYVGYLCLSPSITSSLVRTLMLFPSFLLCPSRLTLLPLHIHLLFFHSSYFVILCFSSPFQFPPNLYLSRFPTFFLSITLLTPYLSPLPLLSTYPLFCVFMYDCNSIEKENQNANIVVCVD